MYHSRRIAMVLMIGCIVQIMAAAPVQAGEIPPALLPWKPWVMHGHEDRFCPMAFNSAGNRHCQWPARLSITVQEQSGQWVSAFVQDISVYAPMWVQLPGDAEQWPETVHRNGKPFPVSFFAKAPAIWCEPGTYRINGVFNWGNQIPEWLSIPPATGIASLSVSGKNVPAPEIYSNRLRLRESSVSSHQEDSETITVFRLIADDIPMQVTTRALIQISGRSRDIRLPDLLLPDGVLLSIDSPLPTRLADDGTLVIQGAPGQWDVRVTTRMSGPITRLSVGKGRYGDEIWSFKAFHHLRMVNISGAPVIEPSRTEMPDEWKNFPAWRMQPQAVLTLDVIRRGDPDPAPDQLTLERTWWLDFDGNGFTLRDRVTGVLNRTWHLAMNTPVELGRVAVDGADQLITRQGADALPGVQLRQGRLALEADSRLSRHSTRLPAVGWDHDFQKVSGTLNLPPGWRLFSVSGVDTPVGAWLQQWTLMDCFLILIIAISLFKLRTPMAGALALITLILIFHEPGAPKTIWLHLLAVTALLRYLPSGGFRKLVWVWGLGAAVALSVIVLPFLLQQVRGAIYPQLSGSGHASGSGLMPALIGGAAQLRQEWDADEVVVESKTMMASSSMDPEANSPMADTSAYIMKAYGRSDKDRFGTEPDALIQTGPGLPAWRWRSVPLRWNGPVDQHQEIRLWLLSPSVNRIVGLIRVALLLGLIGVFLDIRNWRRFLPVRSTGVMTLAMLVFLLLPGGMARAESGANGFPPQPLLDELRQRLLKPPDCLPHCADISHLELIIEPERLELVLSAHAQADTAIPLPTLPESWRPTDLFMDHAPVQGLRRDNRGNLWMILPKGVHEIRMIGPTGAVNDLRIGFPMQPRKGRYQSKGWQVRGFQPDGGMAAAVSLTRIPNADAEKTPLPTIAIPPYFQVTRTFRLGLQWEMITRVQRVTGTEEPAMLSIPLLPGAAITTPGIRMEDGAAQVVLEAGVRQITFSATLPIASRIELAAPADAAWTETWILDAATLWQCTPLGGVAPVHHQDGGRNWRPQWQPWPGETVSLDVTRPAAISGQTLTIDSALLDLTPGDRFFRSVLTLSVRTSRGGRHVIKLPETAKLQDVTLNGRSLPIRQEGQNIEVPLDPGEQTIVVQWLQENPSDFWFQGPVVHIGGNAVNAIVTLHMPNHRWILFTGGPQLGPAVLFWSYGLFVLVISVGLGRIQLTPLRTGHWMLLGLGLTQVPAIFAVVVVGWFLSLGYRAGKPGPTRPILFNLMQLSLAVFTLAMLAVLYFAVSTGLLGLPDMQLAGNGSTRFQLNWTQDRIDGMMPMPWVISLPLWSFHLLMLFWSLWLAFSLVGWMRWGWRCFSNNRLWKPLWHRHKDKSAIQPPASANSEEKTS